MSVYVLGLGRSGTNLVGEIISSAMPTYIEKEPMFSLSVNAAVYKKPIAPLISIYRSKHYQYDGNVCFKNHTDIWHVENLQYIPNSKFVCIERDVNQVIASSLKHEGVRKWVSQDYPPNPLSGNLVEDYVRLDIIERLTLRWLINHQRIQQLQKTDNGDILFMDYSDLVLNTETVINEMEVFLGTKLKIPKIWKNSLTKYLDELAEEDLNKIENTIKKYDHKNLSCL